MSLITKIFQISWLALIGSGVMADPARPLPPIIVQPREVPCEEALKPYMDWVSGATTAPEDVRSVSFMLVFNQQKNPVREGIDSKSNLVGYSVGGLGYLGGSLVGDVTSYFNDRTFCSDNPGGGFCATSSPFNPKATDIAGITISLDGKMTTVLKSWGGSAYHDQLVCLSNGIFYVSSKAGQKSMSVITLQKTGYRRPR